MMPKKYVNLLKARLIYNLEGNPMAELTQAQREEWLLEHYNGYPSGYFLYRVGGYVEIFGEFERSSLWETLDTTENDQLLFRVIEKETRKHQKSAISNDTLVDLFNKIKDENLIIKLAQKDPPYPPAINKIVRNRFYNVPLETPHDGDSWLTLDICPRGNLPKNMQLVSLYRDKKAKNVQDIGESFVIISGKNTDKIKDVTDDELLATIAKYNTETSMIDRSEELSQFAISRIKGRETLVRLYMEGSETEAMYVEDELKSVTYILLQKRKCTILRKEKMNCFIKLFCKATNMENVPLVKSKIRRLCFNYMMIALLQVGKKGHRPS